MLSCEICEVLENLIFTDDCWATPDFQQHFGHITCSISNKLTQSQLTVYNLGQKVGDKFTKLSKIDFSMECFTVDFLQRATKQRENFAIGWTDGCLPSNPSTSEIFLKFYNFLRS